MFQKELHVFLHNNVGYLPLEILQRVLVLFPCYCIL